MAVVKNRLKSWRHQHEMNQSEFAQLLGINPSQYNRYENGQTPSLEVALRISNRLNVPVNDVFMLDE